MQAAITADRIIVSFDFFRFMAPEEIKISFNHISWHITESFACKHHILEILSNIAHIIWKRVIKSCLSYKVVLSKIAYITCEITYPVCHGLQGIDHLNASVSLAYLQTYSSVMTRLLLLFVLDWLPHLAENTWTHKLTTHN